MTKKLNWALASSKPYIQEKWQLWLFILCLIDACEKNGKLHAWVEPRRGSIIRMWMIIDNDWRESRGPMIMDNDSGVKWWLKVAVWSWKMRKRCRQLFKTSASLDKEGQLSTLSGTLSYDGEASRGTNKAQEVVVELEQRSRKRRGL